MNTNYFLNLIMGNIYRTKTNPAIPTKYFLGLSSTEPKNDGTNVSEPSGGGYTRIELAGLSTPINGVISNNSSLAFPESSSVWGGITHYVIFDSLTGGNLLSFGKLNKQRNIDSETVMMIKANMISISLANSI